MASQFGAHSPAAPALQDMGDTSALLLKAAAYLGMSHATEAG